MTSTISLHDALIYVMVITSAADSAMTDRELSSMGQVVRTLPVFNGFDENRIIPVAQECGDRLQAANGMNDVLDLIVASLPERMRDTAYAVAVEIAAADLNVQQEELRLLQILRDRLGLDKLTVAAIERSAQARFRTA
ncbi:tellurite resistance TerB family protein [Rhizobiales bacterium]|uniref:tellurite resistance TerB family protein n=1 Tax=Hongsoonwoonella zoysiae TaxID=2821844 RepID=UPI00156141BA|nr:tellurite resistance TerB family protein [Hongsoonwoonella zoysiae]NRG19639.1 tellurite resistance TerB family protein [Hongsoonwoonella zoysiae]